MEIGLLDVDSHNFPNRFLYCATSFMDYVPRKDGKSVRELYFSGGKS